MCEVGVNIRVLVDPVSPLGDNPFLHFRGFDITPDVIFFSNGSKAIDGEDIEMVFDMLDVPLLIVMVSSTETNIRWSMEKWTYDLRFMNCNNGLNCGQGGRKTNRPHMGDVGNSVPATRKNWR
jgi:hypothetical protein